jgi:hypothetical protein
VLAHVVVVEAEFAVRRARGLELGLAWRGYWCRAVDFEKQKLSTLQVQ